jgi:hypothetical protein
MILVVTYDLKGPTGSYDGLYNALKQQGSWAHYITDTWLISTDKTPQQLFDALLPHLNTKAKDYILITTLGAHWGWLPKDAWEWIKSHSQ